MKVHGKVLPTQDIINILRRVLQLKLSELIIVTKKLHEKNVYSQVDKRWLLRERNAIAKPLPGAIPISDTLPLSKLPDETLRIALTADARYIRSTYLAAASVQYSNPYFIQTVLVNWLCSLYKEEKIKTWVDLNAMYDTEWLPQLGEYLQKTLEEVLSGTAFVEAKELLDSLWDNTEETLLRAAKTLGIPSDELVHTQYRFFPTLRNPSAFNSVQIDIPLSSSDLYPENKETKMVSTILPATLKVDTEIELKAGQQLSHNIVVFDKTGLSAAEITPTLAAAADRINDMLDSWKAYIVASTHLVQHTQRVLNVGMVPMLMVPDTQIACSQPPESHDVDITWSGDRVNETKTMSWNRFKFASFAKKVNASSNFLFKEFNNSRQEQHEFKAISHNTLSADDLIKLIETTVVKHLKKRANATPVEEVSTPNKFRVRVNMFYGILKLSQNILLTDDDLFTVKNKVMFLTKQYAERAQFSSVAYMVIFIENTRTKEFYKYIIQLSHECHISTAPTIKAGVGPHNTYAFIMGPTLMLKPSVSVL